MDLSKAMSLDAYRSGIVAFVYGIVALSKWLGEELLPCGQWPPKFLAALIPRSQGSQPIDLEASTPDAYDLPPHLRPGRPSSASGLHPTSK